MIESLNEEIEIKKTVQFECLLQLVPVTSCSELKRRATQGCVCSGENVSGRTCRNEAEAGFINKHQPVGLATGIQR